MAVREILKMGDPRLLQVSEPVSQFNTQTLNTLIGDMRDTMVASNGAGLAAPQIGVPLSVVIFSVDNNPRYPDAEPVPETILINPSVDILDETPLGLWEGCLSVPGMRGYVERPGKIRYQGFDQKGMPIDRIAEGFHAIVVQHEIDHLNGILYPMRVEDMRLFGFEDALTSGSTND